jgi:hypothetical protein
VFLKKVLPPPSQLKSATLGKQFVIEKWVKGDYGIQAWLSLAINRKKKADAQMGQQEQQVLKRANSPGQKQHHKLSFGRPKKDKYMLLCRVEEEH